MCRSLSPAGFQFRETIVAAFEVPAPDPVSAAATTAILAIRGNEGGLQNIHASPPPNLFACPIGVPWDATGDALPLQPAPVPAPELAWPLWARLVRKLAAPGDVGVGDTIARAIGPLGGDAWKAWYRRATGHSCGCEERQEVLNQLYSYNANE